MRKVGCAKADSFFAQSHNARAARLDHFDRRTLLEPKLLKTANLFSLAYQLAHLCHVSGRQMP